MLEFKQTIYSVWPIMKKKMNSKLLVDEMKEAIVEHCMASLGRLFHSERINVELLTGAWK
jgi:hypothetical protein